MACDRAGLRLPSFSRLTQNVVETRRARDQVLEKRQMPVVVGCEARGADPQQVSTDRRLPLRLVRMSTQGLAAPRCLSGHFVLRWSLSPGDTATYRTAVRQPKVRTRNAAGWLAADVSSASRMLTACPPHALGVWTGRLRAARGVSAARLPPVCGLVRGTNTSKGGAVHTLALVSGKGGVGKTSLTANLGGLLAVAGHRVLLVDLDPQGNLGRDLGHIDRGDGGIALRNAVLTRQPLQPLIGVRTNLDVVPGGPDVEDLSAALGSRQYRDEDWALQLRDSLSPLNDHYDIALLDCPPGIRLLQEMALAACHWAIIPTRSDEASIDGLQRVAERFERVRALWNPDLTLLGVVLFAVGTSSRRIQARTRQILAELLGDHSAFSTTIRSVEAAATDCRRRGELVHELEAAAQEAKPWWQVRREGSAGEQLASSAASLANDYESLAEEVVERIAHLSMPYLANVEPAVVSSQ